MNKGNLNQLRLGIVLSYAAIAVNMIIQLCYSPVMIQLLGQSEYGLYSLVSSVVNYLSLFSLGFGGAYLRFFSRYEVKGDSDAIAKLNGMFLTIFMIMAGIALLVGMHLSNSTGMVFGTNLTTSELYKAEVLMRILVVNVFLTFPDSVFNAIITSHERFVFQKIILIIANICNPIICLPLLFLGGDSITVVSVTTVITMVKLCVHIFYCFRCLKVKFAFHNFEFGLLKEIAGFSFFLFLNMIIDQINWSVDKFILGRVCGTTSVAIYGVAAMINSLYTNFSTSISNVFTPRINQIVAKGENEYKRVLTEYFIRVGRLQFMVLCLLVSGIVVFGEYFITEIYLTMEYRESYIVTLFLIIPATIPLIQNLGIEIQRAMNKHQFRAIIYAIMAFFNLIISIPLASHFGPVGSAMGTAFSLLFANGLIMNIYYHKVLGLDMISFWKSIISLAKGLIVPTTLGLFILNVGMIKNIKTFVFGVVTYIIVYVASFWLFGMNENEKSLFKGVVIRIGRKIMSKSD